MTFTNSMHRRRAAAVAIVGIALGVVGCGSSDTPTDRLTPTSAFSPYVALGDSYTAVSGTDSSIDDPCLRSDNAYPHLLANELGITDVTSVACGGATTANLASTQYPLGKGRNDPQLNALNDQTKLVTIGIGLNDNAYSTLTLVSCFPVNGKPQSTCAPYLARPQSDLDGMVAQIGVNVAAGIKAVKKDAPNARIVFVGYPRLLPEGRDCDAQVPLPKKALERIRTSGVDVNTTLKQVAKDADIDFLDMYAASAGHDVCSAEPWVNGQRTLTGEAFPFHPFPAYHVAVAERLATLLTK